jgi:tetratricopeptide (TPR) repeat protein
LERNTPGPVKKVELRREAKDAFAKGAALGDANCAWWLASKEREDENTDNALDYYQQALELGDAGSAHSIALLLEARGKHDEAEKVYRKGIDGEDALSAAFLAQRLWFKARDAETRDGETAAKLRNEATALYRRAFELGHVSAARDAGDLLRRSGNLQAARRAYLLGAKLRDAECAYQLGLLEEEEREDREAARNAYRLAIRWDDGAIAEKARYRLGALLEAEGRMRAASHLYRAAMGRAGTPVGVPEAAVAFGRYLHKRGERDKAKEAFERGMELDPRAAAPSYIEFLESTYDHDTAAALPIDQSTGLSHADLLRLARLLRYQHAPRAKELLQLAVRAKSADAVIQLHSMLDSHEQKALLQQVSEMDVWFVEHVARLLEENHETYAARELRSLLQPEKPVAEAGAD